MLLRRGARDTLCASGIAFLHARFGLAGCETGSNLLGSSFSASPTAVAEPSRYRSAAGRRSAKIAIAPIIGAPDAVAKQIQQNSRARSRSSASRVATSQDERADYTLRGYIVAARGQDRHQGVLHLGRHRPVRQARQPHHRRGGRPPTPGKDPVGGRDAAGRAIDRRQGRRLASLAWLPSQSSQVPCVQRRLSQPAGVGAQPAAAAPHEPPAVPPARDRRQPAPTTGSIGTRGTVSAIVPTVTGAPGDGSTSLTARIQRELSARASRSPTGRPRSLSGRGHGHGRPGQGRQAADPHRVAVQRSAGQEARHRVAEERDPARLARRRLGQDGGCSRRRAAQGIIKLLPQPKAVN